MKIESRPLPPRLRAQSGVRGLLATAAGLLALCVSAAAPSGAQGLVERVVAGLSRPVFLTAPPGDFERVFVIEQQTGNIQIVRPASHTVDATPFLTVGGLATGFEQGLLGLAFHPDYATNGFLYVYITDPDTRILRYTVSPSDPDLADPGSELQILAIDQPQASHNGGWIGFGPDGYLYVATGDGGGANDEGTGHTPVTGNAQDVTDNLLGKILRIDVDADDFPADATRNYAIPADNPFVGVTGDDEIWVYGLRNPFRSSFDRQTGDLWIGDVGQGACEEVDVLVGGGVGGENLGWRLREGTIATPTVGGARPPGNLEPIFDYPHPSGPSNCSGPPAGFEGIAVTGGYVYRGPVAELQGRYFFGDFGSGDLWSLRFDDSAPGAFDGTNYTELTEHRFDPRFVPDVGTIAAISSFGEDAAGRLYVLDYADGDVFAVPEPGGASGAWVAVGAVFGVVAWRRIGRAALDA